MVVMKDNTKIKYIEDKSSSHYCIHFSTLKTHRTYVHCWWKCILK